MNRHSQIISADSSLPAFRRAPGAVAIDLDGTLLDSGLQVSERNRRAIGKCLERGIPVIIATSRTIRAVRRLVGDELAGMCSLVMQNGAVVKAAPPLEGDYQIDLPEAVVRGILAMVMQMEPEARITLEIAGYQFGTNRPLDAARLWEVNSATPEMQLTLEEAIRLGPAKIAVGGLGRGLSHVIKAISARFRDDILVVPSDGLTFLNITGAGAAKPEALRKILASRNIRMDSVLAFGDDIPDLEMLRACGVGVAMGNAVPAVKAASEYVTLSNDEDGVAAVLEKILAGIS